MISGNFLQIRQNYLHIIQQKQTLGLSLQNQCVKLLRLGKQTSTLYLSSLSEVHATKCNNFKTLSTNNVDQYMRW